MARARLVAALVAVVVVGAAVAILLAGRSPREQDRVETTAPRAAVTTTAPASTEDLFEAACAGRLTSAPGRPIAHPELTEVSGIAVVGSTTWLLNDSGDGPRLYGVGPDGSFRTVTVKGAENVDWEDLAYEPGAGGDHLWIADTGGNVSPRDTVQLYRVPVPAAGATSVDAQRIEVIYPDGSHDTEALVVEPSGSILLLTKAAGESRIYRVDTGHPATIASLVGSFAPTERDTSVVTGAALSADGRTLAVRTYGGVRLYRVPASGTPADALLAGKPTRCEGAPSSEVQGEAVAFLPDGRGYVTVPEGRNPVITTVRVPG